MKTQSVTYILQTGTRYWAKGSTVKEAALGLHKAGAGKKDKVAMLVMLGDPKAFIDNNGMLCFGGSEAPDAWYTDSQLIGSISQLIK